MLRSIYATAICACAISLSGCGGGVAQEPTLKAAGKVTYEDGVPVTQVAVVFQRVGDKSCSALGRLDEQGNFVLTTFSQNDGVPAGKYQVYFTTAPPESMTMGPPKIDPGAPPKPPVIVMPDRIVPAAYLSPDQTPLTVDISDTTDSMNLKLSVKRPSVR